MAGELPYQDIGRKRPARGVRVFLGKPNIVFLTVCTQDRRSCLACSAVHEHLRAAWQKATAWLVGYYVIMPDHVHLFCAPHDLTITIERWCTYWEREFRRLHQDPGVRWQAHPFHHRLRRGESYAEKWSYVR